jgi:mannose-1-phosphate guanylyltransferase/mannose-6-phosphate isomerase
MHSLILCGGSGTRLWPLSRKNYPKQFLNLYNGNSLIQETYLRLREIQDSNEIFFITNKANFFNVLNQIRELDKNFSEEQIIIEPASLNTMPAITLGIKHLVEKANVNFDEAIFITPSDHYIENQEEYLKKVKQAAMSIGESIGTIGITPTKPETGYGYIKKGEVRDNYFLVEKFVEKPDQETAEKYLASGEYVWNSGMYILTPRTLARELSQHAPEFYRALNQEYSFFIENFSTLSNTSIDFAISEYSKNIIVFEGDFGWNDIGSFDSLAEVLNEKNNNYLLKINSKNIFCHSAQKKLIVASGVEDLIVVDSSDSILIQKKGSSEQVKKIVEHLEKNNMKEIEHNLLVHRPWGKYEVLIDRPDHKVKKITVYPNAKLSLQSHYHRAEHWVVIKGTAKIYNKDKEIILCENESTFISALSKHRLENPGKINLEMIEVQTGKYLEEDDIIRYDDIYNRTENKA